MADYQTAGKGRFDRQWESPVAQDLLFSFIVKPATGIDQWSKITFPLGLAIRSALLDYVPAHYPIQLKWPNDILINNQKCAGMLASINVDMDILILGVGLNVNQIPTQMTRTSLAALSNQKLNRFQILQDVISSIDQSIEKICSSFIDVDQWHQHAAFLNQFVSIKTTKGNKLGYFKGINKNGAMILEIEHKIEEIMSGSELRLEKN